MAKKQLHSEATTEEESPMHVYRVRLGDYPSCIVTAENEDQAARIYKDRLRIFRTDLEPVAVIAPEYDKPVAAVK